MKDLRFYLRYDLKDLGFEEKWGFEIWLNPNRKIMKLAYHIETASSNQIFHNDKDHQILFMGGPNKYTTNPRWQMTAILKNRLRYDGSRPGVQSASLYDIFRTRGNYVNMTSLMTS